MSIVTFWNGTKTQCGTTSSAIALATQIAIDHNMKVLLLSTSIDDHIINESFWYENNNKKTLGIFEQKVNDVDKNGIDGLARLINSNRMNADNIKDYTRVILTNRLEILLGAEKQEKKQYEFVKKKYNQVIMTANQYYDMVIVDLDKNIEEEIQKEILKDSNVVVSILSQRAKEIEQVIATVKEGKWVKEEKVIYAIGKYIEGPKYNVKNISRNLMKKREIISTIPYNNLFFEASQEAKVIDLFLNLMRIKDKDINYNFISQIKELEQLIKIKIQTLKLR